KQSIYRFRGADPGVFQRAEITVDEGKAVVTLDENRRSSPSLVRFFARLFPPLFAGRLPWADTSEFGRPPELARLRDVLDHAPVPWDRDIVALRSHDSIPGTAVDLLLRSRDRPATLDALRAEADRVAAHVRGMLGETTDEGPQLSARDIAILVPRWHQSETMRAALEAQGIAADLAGGRGLLTLPEVRDLVNLLRLWVDDRDELAAVAVLRGPCFAISDLGLYVLARWPGVDRRLREADPDLPEFAALDELWEPWDDEQETSQSDESAPRWPRSHPRRMREVLRHGRLDPARALRALEAAGVLGADADPQALRAQLQADADALEANRDRFRALVRHAGARPSADLLADLIAALHLEAAWLAGPRGRRAVANAWRFVEHVRALEPEGPDLQRLVTWLDAGAEPAPEGLISPAADAVTITTWHGSKGKEWPVVVVAGFGEFRQAGARTSWSGAPVPTLDVLANEALAVPRIRGPHEGFVAPADPLHEPCENMLTPLEAAEAKRLVYVAMTRARDRLILSGEADGRAHVHFDDKPWLGLDWRYDMKHLVGEPKPAYLCKRPIELLVAGLDIPAGVGPVLWPRAAAWSLAHLRVIDDEMLVAGLSRPLPARVEIDDAPPESEAAPIQTAAPPAKTRKRARDKKNQGSPLQLGLFAVA
ncbi:MAG: hypothetical protein KC431_07565, partial [Myxococcales bacterium]|nr:hypothetical protein [Myxococcales bacterium]